MNVKKNFIYNVIYQILVMVMPLITAPYVTRILGDEQLGFFSYTYSIASYFSLFAILGLNNYGNRTIARVRNDKDELSKTFWEIFCMQMLLGVLVCIAYLLWAIYLYDGNKLLTIIQVGYVITEAFSVNWLFFGLEKFKLTVTRNIVIKLSSVLAIFTFVKDTNDVVLYAIIMVMASLISQAILWFYVPKEVFWKRPSMSGIIKHIKPNLILFIPVIAVSVYKVMDKIMLGAMTTMSQVAYYEYGEKVVSMSVSVITALGTVMMPRISNLMAQGDRQQSMNYIKKSMMISIMLSSAMSFGILAVGEKFAVWFLGKDFLMSGKVMSGLAIALVFMSCANVVRTQYLIPTGKDDVYIKSVILGAIVNVVINYLLIPHYYALGAVGGTVLAEFAVMIYQMFKVRKELPVRSYLKEGIPFFLIGFVMFCIVIFVGTFNIQTVFLELIIEIMTGGIIYILLVIVYLKQFDNSMYQSIMGVFQKRGKDK